MSGKCDRGFELKVPEWVPDSAIIYLRHVEKGRSIRSLAREQGVHASTILRKVRQYETRRDDLLIDLALRRLARTMQSRPHDEGLAGANDVSQIETQEPVPAVNDDEIRKTAPRILRRLNETGACLAIAKDMDKGVVVRDGPDGRAIKTAVLDRPLAEAIALKDWITVTGDGRITRYKITAAGRSALKRFLAEDEALRAGFGEAADPFSEQHKDWAERAGTDKNKRRGMRYNAAESPLSALSRRKDKDGKPFLAPDLVAAGERLREDFELAQMGPRITQNWEHFLTGGARSEFGQGGESGGSAKARERVMGALADLGPGLGDVVLRCCCFLEGMEAVERHMGWSARSGKVVLRIALIRLKGHYDEESGNWSPLIG